MTEPPVWPPPPQTPNLLAVHDEYLTACIRNSAPKPPLSRLRLVKYLRQETGQDLRSSLAVVNNFCDRHAILMPLSGFWTWGAGCLLPLLNMVVPVAMGAALFTLTQRDHAATTRLARAAIRVDATNVMIICMCLFAVSTSAVIVTIVWRIKKQRRQAEEARAKFVR